MRLRVHLTARGEDGVSIPLGSIEGVFPDVEAGKSQAYQDLWDHRLDAASCHPIYDWEQLPVKMIDEHHENQGS